jgi:hypothetical protein
MEHKKGKYHCTVDLLFDWFGISCMTADNFCFYLQNRLIQTGQTGGQLYNDTSPFSVPWLATQKRFITSGFSIFENGFEEILLLNLAEKILWVNETFQRSFNFFLSNLIFKALSRLNT